MQVWYYNSVKRKGVKKKKNKKKIKKSLDKQLKACYNKYIKRKKEVMRMKNIKVNNKKADFVAKFKSDYAFRHDMRQRGVRVVGDNVIFFNSDGTVRNVAGVHTK